MNKYVLFSPIGATDPVRDDYDGPMLHIVRHYKPERIYLFYTKEMKRKSELVRKALESFDVKLEEILTDIDNPHDFDIFARKFDPLLNRIQAENPDSKLLVNITSGTPQMNSALCLEVVTSNVKLNAIQVASPSKGSNENKAHGGKLDENLDNIMEDGEYISPNRCIEPNLLTFKRASLKRDIISLTENYEYRAAYKKLKQEIELFNEEVLTLVEYANLRQNDNNKFENSRWHNEFNFIEDEKVKLACDYYCILSNKAKTGELSYFVLLLKVLAEYIAQDLTKNINEIEANKILNQYYILKNRGKYIPHFVNEKGNKTITYNLEQYIALMRAKRMHKPSIESLSKINEQIGNRNALAHKLHRETKINTNLSLNLLRQLITDNYIDKVEESGFKIYDLINEKIKDIL